MPTENTKNKEKAAATAEAQEKPKKRAKKATGEKSAKTTKTKKSPAEKTTKKRSSSKKAAFDRDKIFAEVFGIDLKPAKKTAKKTTKKATEKSAEKGAKKTAPKKVSEIKEETVAETKEETATKKTGRTKKAKKEQPKKSEPKAEEITQEAPLQAEQPKTEKSEKPKAEKAEQPKAEKSEKPSEEAEPKKDVSAVQEPKKFGIYEKIVPGKPTIKMEKKPVQAKKEPSFSSFGKLSADDLAELKNKNKQQKETKNEPKKATNNKKKADKKGEKSVENSKKRNDKRKNEKISFNRDEIFASVFGYDLNPLKSENKQTKANIEQTKGVSAEKETKEQPKKVTKKPFDRDEIFALVFGYEYKKAEEKPAKPEKAEPKKEKHSIFEFFTITQRRDVFEARQRVFDREKVFAEVFGLVELKKEETKKATSEIQKEKPQPKKKQNKKNGKGNKKEDKEPKKEKQTAEKKVPSESIQEKEIRDLIENVKSVNYPKQTLSKPMTKLEKSWCDSFASFFKNRGYTIEFKDDGSNKTGVVVSNLIKSGGIENTIAFLNKAKSAFSVEANNYEDFISSDKRFSVLYNKKLKNVAEAARVFGIVTEVAEVNDYSIKVYFSKRPKVIDFFKGKFLESYAYYVASDVVKKYSKSHDNVSFEIASNGIIRDKNHKAVHEFDTLIKLGDAIYILEEKSSTDFTDFDKFADDMDELEFDKSHYMMFVMNKGSEETDAIEWFFDFNVANLDNFRNKLTNMLNGNN